MKKCTFLILFILVCISFNMVACSYNNEELSNEKVSNANLTERSLYTNLSNTIITENYGKLVGGFTYEIDENSKAITINGEGELTEDLLPEGSEFIWAMCFGDYYRIEKFDKEYKIVYGFNDGTVHPKHEYSLIIGDGITKIGNLYKLFRYVDFSSIYIGEKVKEINRNFLTHFSKIDIDPNNHNLALYNNCLYTKDYTKILYAFIDEENLETFSFHPNVHTIGENSIVSFPYGGTLVIPWGVTTFEGPIDFYIREWGFSFVLPDTLINFDGYIQSTDYGEIILSGNNKKLIEASQKGDGLHSSLTVIDKNYYDYYDIIPTSLKTFQNGKTYYFDNNYKMAKGWTKVKNTWYYFNDYGAAVVKIWLKSGGKWYYMQEDGTMATNKWIKWYNKWYYVGKDGAMYANRKTPDGYYVNASGVWVK